MIELISIQFAHHPTGDFEVAAYNVRKNATTEIAVPEWVPGRTAADSRAVYDWTNFALQRLVAIKVRLRTTNLNIGSAYISARAISSVPESRRGCGFFARWFTRTRPNPADINVNILTGVREQLVNFGADGESGEIIFYALYDYAPVIRITSGTTTWIWSSRQTPEESLTSFIQTQHTFYSIFRPAPPWVLEATDESSRHHLLWTDVLDHVCWWARGTQDPMEGATWITQQMYLRGSPDINRLRYEHVAGRASFANRETHRFDLQGFLNAIDLAGTGITTVNSDDCACALVCFINAVCGGTSVLVIGAEPQNAGEAGLDRKIYLNKVRPIGSEWDHVIDSQRDGAGSFLWHHSAVIDPYHELIWDATLQVTERPGTPERTPLYVAEFKFGRIGEVDYFRDPDMFYVRDGADRWLRYYRYHLAKPDDTLTSSQTACNPRQDLQYIPIIWWE
jgi:hypothetical protein